MKIFRVMSLYLMWCIFSPVISYASDSPTTHRLAAISILGYALEIEDGSQWSVSPIDSYKIFRWNTNDRLAIIPNEGILSKYRLFSEYKYKILNEKTQEEIEVNLHISPIRGGQRTHSIIDINSDTREVTLQDRSRWKIHRCHRKEMDRWEHDHLIIIGTYKGGYFSLENFILINVNTGDYCRAALL